MSFFSDLLDNRRRITADEYALDLGGIVDDVADMLDGEQARAATRLAREEMERSGGLPSGQPLLRRVEFGRFEDAPELLAGTVAAVDGTNVLPLQIYSAGQAVCVGVGSLSHRRSLHESMQYWSSRALLQAAPDVNAFVRKQQDINFKINATGYLRYCELEYGLGLKEPYVLFDGPLVYEWLLTDHAGVDVYRRLLGGEKRCLGIVKDLRQNTRLIHFARALRPGELFLAETWAEHLADDSSVLHKYRSQAGDGASYVLSDFRDLASKIWRGVFKPRLKAFGFEVHEDHLEDMLRIMAADCETNNVGHEIPYLLNSVDLSVRRAYNCYALRDRISARLGRENEELFFDETDEREFR